MTEPDDEQLQQYLAGHSEVSLSYRKASTETTPPELDARILHAARRELRPSRRRWSLPLALAAAVVLSVSVLLQMPAQRTLPVISNATPPRTATVESQDAATSAAEPAAAAAAPQPRTQQAPPRAQDKKAAAPAAGPSASMSADLRSATPAMTPTVMPTMTLDDDAAAARSDAALSAPQAPAANLAAPAPIAQRRSAPSFAAPAAKAEALDGASSAGQLQMPLRSPQEWIAQVRELRAHGEVEQAARELRALHAQYPDYVLPPDLSPPP